MATKDQKLSYLTNCMELCWLFGDISYNISVNIGCEFSFTVNHGWGNKQLQSQKRKKYVSPSTRRRNFCHLMDYKAKKTGKGSELPPGMPPGVGRSPPGSHPGEEQLGADVGQIQHLRGVSLVLL